ncbi:hypothetical protein Kim5_CH01251 [Rhizobium sp. Kim5]|nr:hypothetical protein Kim5_CH01251 [Rhizobium sp. Kim5]
MGLTFISGRCSRRLRRIGKCRLVLSGISLPLGYPSKTIGLLAADDPAACAKYVVIIRC